MALKFQCHTCRNYIIVKYLKVGEIAKCKACGAENIVPNNALEQDESALVRFCSICGTENELYAQVCKKCRNILSGSLKSDPTMVQSVSKSLKANRKIVENKFCKICNSKFILGEDINRCESCLNFYHSLCWDRYGGCNQHGYKEYNRLSPLGETMFCPYCKTKLNKAFKICPNCKKNLEMVTQESEYYCDSCEKDVPADAIFCPFCGTQLEERKNIMHETPTETKISPIAGLLKANKKIVEENCCKICNGKFSIGDHIRRCESCLNYFHNRCWEVNGGCNQHESIEDTKPCPICGKEIKRSALKCRHCGQYLDETIKPRQTPKGTVKEASTSLTYAIIGIFLFGFILGWVAISNGNKALKIIEADPGYKGKGMAIAGIIIGIFDILGWIIAIISRFSYIR